MAEDSIRKQKINLKVDNETLSLEVFAHEESLYRKAAEHYNERLIQYRKGYASHKLSEYKDQTRLFAGLDMALKVEMCAKDQNRFPMEKGLQKLCQELHKFLGDEDV